MPYKASQVGSVHGVAMYMKIHSRYSFLMSGKLWYPITLSFWSFHISQNLLHLLRMISICWKLTREVIFISYSALIRSLHLKWVWEMSDLICARVFKYTVRYFLSLVLFFLVTLVTFPYLKYVMNCPLCDDVIPHEISVCVQQHCSLLD